MCRNQQTAKIFAIKYGIPNAMEGYEALAACDDVNVVYVGTINTTHLDVVKVIETVLNFKIMFHSNQKPMKPTKT